MTTWSQASSSARVSARWLGGVVLAIGVLACPRAAEAQTCSFSVSAPSFSSPEVSSNLLDGFATDTFGTFNANCSGGTAGSTIQICPNFTAGTGGADSSGSPRYMKSGANQIEMNLFQDASRTVVWGSTLGGMGTTRPPALSITFGSGGTGSTNAPVFARIRSGQNTARTGTYATTIGMSTVYGSGGTGDCSGFAGATDTSNFTVTAIYTPTCTLSTAPLNFGSFSSLATARDSDTALSVRCSNASAYSVALNGGLTNASDPTQRKMRLGADTLTYGLYRDPSRAAPWDATVNVFSSSGTGNTESLPVYGRIPIQPLPPAGTYTDTIVATVTY